MTTEEVKTVTPIPNIVHIMDINAFIENLKDELPEMAHFSVTFNRGEPTVAFSLPNSISEDFNSKWESAAKLTYALIEQAARHEKYNATECEDEDKHKKWDVGTA